MMNSDTFKPSHLFVVLVLTLAPALFADLRPTSYLLVPEALVSLLLVYLGQLALLYSCAYHGRAVDCSFGSVLRHSSAGVAIGISLLGLGVAVAATYSLFGGSEVNEIVTHQLHRPRREWDLVREALLLVLVLASVVREELVYRVWMIEGLGGNVGTGSAVILQALLFAFMHSGYGIAGVLTAMVAALLLGTIYASRRNLLELVVGHGIYNILVYYGAGGAA